MSDEVKEIGDEQEHVDYDSQWEFIGRVPSAADVLTLLAKLPPVWGVQARDFIDFVQPLPQKKRVKVPHPTNPALTVDEFRDCFTLYVSVAGRQAMLRSAQEAHGWRVDYRPEPVTPSGVPGYLSFKDKLVYRVYVDIYAPAGEITRVQHANAPASLVVNAAEWVLLGTRSGTAWVPESGGKNAAESNPYEKVETSALGRALGAWGFGVLPGSGIATVEEMAAIAGNRRALDRQAAQDGGSGRQSREELLEATFSVIEAYRQEAAKDELSMQVKVGEYLSGRLKIPRVWDAVKHTIDWDVVKDGQLMMLKNDLEAGLRSLRDAQFGA